MSVFGVMKVGVFVVFVRVMLVFVNLLLILKLVIYKILISWRNCNVWILFLDLIVIDVYVLK